LLGSLHLPQYKLEPSNGYTNPHRCTKNQFGISRYGR